MLDKNQMMRREMSGAKQTEDWATSSLSSFSIDDANGNQIFLFFSDNYRGEKT